MDFFVEISFMYFGNLGYIYWQMVLEQVFFVGWEIINICFEGVGIIEELDYIY